MNFVREMISPHLSIFKKIDHKPANSSRDNEIETIKADLNYKTYTLIRETSECTCGLCAHPRGCIDSICHPKTAQSKSLKTKKD